MTIVKELSARARSRGPLGGPEGGQCCPHTLLANTRRSRVCCKAASTGDMEELPAWCGGEPYAQALREHGQCVARWLCECFLLPLCGSQAHVARHMEARPAVLARARMPRHFFTSMRAWSATVGGCRLVSCRRCGAAHPLHLCGAHTSGPQLAKRAHGVRRVLPWSVMVSLSLSIYLHRYRIHAGGSASPVVIN